LIRLEKGKFASIFKLITRLDSLTESGYLLELLEANCSRAEIESAMSMRLDDDEQLRFIVTNRWIPLYKRFETICGRGKALIIALRVRIRQANERSFILQKMTYPCILLLSGFSVIWLYLFVIRPSIDPSRQAFQLQTGIETATLQSMFIVLILFLAGGFLVTFYLYHSHKNELFKSMAHWFPNNPWRLKMSLRFAFLILQLHNLGLSTREIYTTIQNLENEPILSLISSDVLQQIHVSGRFDDAFEQIDPALGKILLFENHPDFPARLERYDLIVKKRFDRQVTRCAYFSTILAYFFISILILTLYQEMLFPLKVLQNLH